MAEKKRRRIRPVLLVLLWAWAIVVFLIVDLFWNVSEFDGVRPRAALYQGMRKAAHDMVGEPLVDPSGEERAEPVVGSLMVEERPNPYAGRKSAPPGTRPPRAVRTHKRTAFRDHGTWTQWNLPGLKTGEGERNEKGRKQGAWTWKWKDGSQREERHYDDGTLHGSVKSWFEDGQQQVEENYVQGKRAGTWKYWHPNGQLAAQETYEAGLPEGEWTMWFADGTKAMQGSYQAGKPVGTWSFWNEDGGVLKQQKH
jgi:hypothetical protein